MKTMTMIKKVTKIVITTTKKHHKTSITDLTQGVPIPKHLAYSL